MERERKKSNGSWRRSGKLSLGLTLLVLHGASLATVPSEAASGSEILPVARVRVSDPATEWPLQRAIRGAHEWLGDRSCQQVFSDFEDPSGTPLSEVLAERQLNGQHQLGRLAFWDGSHLPPCRGRGVAAFTQPGHHIIYVCPARFRSASRDPERARAIVVHELLHSLGLGENPPTSREITERVLERCRS